MAKITVDLSKGIEEKALNGMKERLATVYNNIKVALDFIKARTEDSSARASAIDGNEILSKRVTNIVEFEKSMGAKLAQVLDKNIHFRTSFLSPENIDKLSEQEIVWIYDAFSKGKDDKYRLESLSVIDEAALFTSPELAASSESETVYGIPYSEFSKKSGETNTSMEDFMGKVAYVESDDKSIFEANYKAFSLMSNGFASRGSAAESKNSVQAYVNDTSKDIEFIEKHKAEVEKNPILQKAFKWGGWAAAGIMALSFGLGFGIPWGQEVARNAELQADLDKTKEEFNQYLKDVEAMNTFFAEIVADNNISNDETIMLTMISGKMPAPNAGAEAVSTAKLVVGGQEQTITKEYDPSNPYAQAYELGYTDEQLSELYKKVQFIIEGSASDDAAMAAETMLKIADLKEIITNTVEVESPVNEDLTKFIVALYSAIKDSQDANLDESTLDIIKGYEESMLSGETAEKLGLSFEEKDGKRVVKDQAGNEYSSVSDYIEEYVSQKNSYNQLQKDYEELYGKYNELDGKYNDLDKEYNDYKNNHQDETVDISDIKAYISKVDEVLDKILELIGKNTALSEEEINNLNQMFTELATQEADVAEKYGLDINIKDNINELYNKYEQLKADYDELYADVKDFVENDLTYADYTFLQEAAESMAGFLRELDAFGNEIVDTLNQDKISEEDRAKLNELYSNAKETEETLKTKYQDYLGENFGIMTDYKDFGNKYQTLVDMYNSLYQNSNAGAQEVVDYQALVAAMDAFAKAIDEALADNQLNDRERASLESFKNDLAAKESVLNEKYGSNTQIGEHLNNALSKFNTLQSKINELGGEIDKLNGSISNLESSVKDLNAQIDRLEEILKGYHTDEEYKDLARQLAEAAAALEEKNKEFNDKVEEYNNLKDLYDQAVADRDAAQRELEEYKNNNFTHTEAEFEELNGKLTAAENALNDYKATHSHTDAEYKQLEADRDAAEKALNNYKATHSYTDEEYLKLVDERNAAQKELNDYKATHSHADSEYLQLQNKLTEAEKNLENYKNTHSHLDTEYEDLANQYAEAKKKLDEYANSHTDDDYKELLNKLDEATSALEEYKKTHPNTAAEYEALEDSLKAAKKALTDYQANHSHTDAQYNALDADLKAAQSELNNHKATHSHSNSEYNDLLSRYNSTNSQLSELQQELATLRDSLANKDTELAELEEQLATLMAEAADNQAFLRELYYQLVGLDAGGMTDEEIRQAIAELLSLGYEGGDNGNSGDHNHNKPGAPEYGG